MRLQWDQVGKKEYETGASHAAVYPIMADGSYGEGEAWNGFTGIDEAPTGGEETPLYANNSKYGSLYSAEDYAGTVKGFMYPDTVAMADGSIEVVSGVTVGQQDRVPFGMTVRNEIGNDTKGTGYGYKLTLIWGMKLSPSQGSNNTINESPTTKEYSWGFTTTTSNITHVMKDGTILKPAAYLKLNSTKIDAAKLKALEDILYGKDATTEPASEAIPSRLPSINEVLAMLDV